MVPLSIEALVAPPPPRGAPPAVGGTGFQQIVAGLAGDGATPPATPLPVVMPPVRVGAPAAPVADPEQILAQFALQEEAPPPPPPPAPDGPPQPVLAANPDLDLPLDRQNLAGEAPAEDAPADQDEDKADEVNAPIGFAWMPALPATMPQVSVPASPVSIAVRVARQAPASPEQAAVAAELIEQSVDLGRIQIGERDAPQPMLAAEWKALAAKLEAAAAPAQPQTQQHQPAQPAQPIEPPPVAVPVLAAAIASTLGNPIEQTESPAPDPFAADALAALRPGHSPVAHRIEAAGGASEPGIDTARAEWIEAMIERIDEFQSQRDSNATRIRLAPDALGTVDVSIRRENGVVHVNFAAENPAARSLLADATPRLAELAEARGLRLGDAGVGSQGSQGSREQPAQSRVADERAPNRAPRAAAARADTRTGERIA